MITDQEGFDFEIAALRRRLEMLSTSKGYEALNPSKNEEIIDKISFVAKKANMEGHSIIAGFGNSIWMYFDSSQLTLDEWVDNSCRWWGKL